MNDLRKYINLIENDFIINEAGGIIDRTIAKLGKIPGLQDISIAALARIDEKELYKKLRQAWIREATHKKVKKNDSEALKIFLHNVLGLDDEQINGISELNQPKVNFNQVLKQVSAILSSYGLKVQKNKKTQKVPLKPSITKQKLDTKTLKYFDQLNGNKDELQRQLKTIIKNPKVLKKDLLALIGYFVLKNTDIA